MNGALVILLIDIPRDGSRPELKAGTKGHVEPLYTGSGLLLFTTGTVRAIVPRSAVRPLQKGEAAA